MKIEICLSSAMQMYHGSQTEAINLKNLRLLFLTNSIKVARDYANGNVAFTGARKGPITPTLYSAQVDPKHIFDLRKEECREDYVKLRKAYPDEELPPLKSEGFIMGRTGLPSYGHVRGMRDGLVQMGYDCMWVDEGSQGLSLAIFQSTAISSMRKLSMEKS